MNIRHLKKLLPFLSILVCLPVVADESATYPRPDYSLFPKFELQYEDSKSFHRSYTPESAVMVLPGESTSVVNNIAFDQLDAGFYYPLGQKGMSFDLGINMKYLNGKGSRVENGEYSFQRYQKTIPMISAKALFDLPFKGLSAGFEGKHQFNQNIELESSFDYKARLNYEWQEGIGLQGGWQHQQWVLDNNDPSGLNFEDKGPFLDFYLRF